MHRLLLLTIFGALAWLAGPPTATAASSEQIHRDAADGSIDGNYTLAEMREADRTVNSEQREYFAWDDAYGAYMRAIMSPGSQSVPRVAPSELSNGTGVSSGNDAPRTPSDSPDRPAPATPGATGARSGSPSASNVTSARGVDRVDGIPVADATSGSLSLPFMLLVAIVLLSAIAAGVVTVRRHRSRDRRTTAQ